MTLYIRTRLWYSPASGSVNPSASIGPPNRSGSDTGGSALASSTPDALWNAPSLRALVPAAVTCTDLRRRRDLDHCSFSVPAGARLLVVSDPERSASTLLRILGGLAPSEGGRIGVAGLSDPTAEGWGRRVAYLGPRAGLHDWMAPMEALHLAGELLTLPADETERRADRLLRRTGIDRATAGRPIGRGGEPLRQRTGLACALLGDPEVLLLDEPLRAIEPRERTRLLRVPGARRTVLLASRNPTSEVGLIDSLLYLRDGGVRAHAPLSALDGAGLPLTRQGIADLSDLMAASHPSRRAAG